jgi:integrator complex subunit 9
MLKTIKIGYFLIDRYILNSKFQVDVILVSNYSCMLALPFITEGSDFHGVVYATEPTLQIGRLFLEELVQTVERSPKAGSAKHWKALQHLLPPPLNDAPFPKAWRQLFDAKRVAASLAKIQMVGYNEKLVSAVFSFKLMWIDNEIGGMF